MRAIFALAAVGAALFMAAALVTNGAVPQLINYQGRLTDTLGNPVPDSNYQITFTIYGGLPPLAAWSSGPQTVLVVNGLFSYQLGSAAPLPPDLFASDTLLWLGIQVGSDLEISPRTRLTSVPYAYHALRADTAEVALSGVGGDGGWIVDGDIRVIGNANIGYFHEVSAFASSVTGGYADTVTGDYAFVGGGYLNQAHGWAPAVAGGFANHASERAAFVGGGSENGAFDTAACVAGGSGNHASGYASTVAGGAGNSASGRWAFVGGGCGNGASDTAACVGGGSANHANGRESTIAGGTENAAGRLAFVGGGFRNLAYGNESTIAGGRHNYASGSLAFVGGGDSNAVSGEAASVVGGWTNRATGDGASVVGGNWNLASGFASFVGGGDMNVAGGDHSFAAGYGAHASHHGTFVWADRTDIDFVSTGEDQFLIRAAGGVGIGTASPQGALDVNSTTGAFLVPRMTTTERDALTTANGMIIYNTTTNQFNFYENGAWTTK